MEGTHEEALSQVIEVLTQSQHVVALPPGACIQPTTFHSRAEGTDGGAAHLLGLLQDPWGRRGRGEHCAAPPPVLAYPLCSS